LNGEVAVSLTAVVLVTVNRCVCISYGCYMCVAYFPTPRIQAVKQISTISRKPELEASYA